MSTVLVRDLIAEKDAEIVELKRLQRKLEGRIASQRVEGGRQQVRLQARVDELEARADSARKLECFAANPVCRCCVEIVDVLFPKPLDARGESKS